MASVHSVSAPKPHGAIPSERQLRWQAMEVTGFIHFTVNTFTDKEWGYGDESPEIFAPTAFDAGQIAGVAAEAGMKGLILTAKHHDGFCLWPSAYTDHSVKHSPWRGGQGDVVRELATACQEQGIGFGIYLSPWDRNHPRYGHPDYLTYYRNQLRELLSNYGPLFEVWFDGANGGEGYYGGARENRRIDKERYYDWETTWSIVRELQPEAVIFSDAGPDIRWVGNESGVAGDPCWGTISPDGMAPGLADPKVLNTGHRNGSHWRPAEVDVSIRPGWFYHAHEDDQVRSPENLLQVYYESVGRGCNLLLNLPPDRRGLIHERDVASLREWRRILDATFATDLARGARVTASNTRGNDPRFAPTHVIDGRRDTYWATDDDVRTPELVLDLGRHATFNVVCVREYLPLGQRVDSIALDRWDGERWVEFASATGIGAQRLIRLPERITTDRVRLRVTGSPVCPAISELGLFAEP
ncbi:MAG TPA: alpha-L-fucosidase [Armatimonadota bacterium]|nr:alpha-L-fucosidase [Armatimonadota bacterium]HOM83801.1 alpha-L-fucosidase [Armatimonadota bacterium]HPO73229.1 alpha-L-fucosidase [Armatimonadota bacterium]